MIIDIILVITGLLALLAASISDIKTREVPDWISYGLIATGFFLRLIHSIIYNEWMYFFYGLIGFTAMFILGNIMFQAKQWGGGDTKLIMGVGIVYATTPYYLSLHTFPFLIITLLNILILGAMYGIVYGIMLAINNKKKFKEAFILLNKGKRMMTIKITALVIALAFMIITLKSNIEPQIKIMLNSMALLIILYPYLTLCIKAVEKGCLYKHIKAEDLTPGDWVEQDVIKDKKIIYKKRPLGIEEGDILRLKKAKINKVLVKEGIPFIPPFFLGVVITIITGKIIGIF
jgi:Flp pilus assembly protein protease CpaA